MQNKVPEININIIILNERKNVLYSRTRMSTTTVIGLLELKKIK